MTYSIPRLAGPRLAPPDERLRLDERRDERLRERERLVLRFDERREGRDERLDKRRLERE